MVQELIVEYILIQDPRARAARMHSLMCDGKIYRNASNAVWFVLRYTGTVGLGPRLAVIAPASPSPLSLT